MVLPPTWDMFGDDHLPHRVLLLAKLLDRETARQLQADFGLTLAEWRVLAFICSVNSASAADVGAAFEVDRAEVSRAVKRLENGGLVQRSSDSDNRKRRILEPTELGRTIFEQARGRRRDYFRGVMADLESNERDVFAAALKKMALRVTKKRISEI